MTITAEQARALQAGITPGRWKTADALGPGGTICYEDVSSGCGIKIAAVWGSDDSDFIPDRKARAANASAIAAVPDMLATIIAQDARIAALEAERDLAVAAAYEDAADAVVMALDMSGAQMAGRYDQNKLDFHAIRASTPASATAALSRHDRAVRNAALKEAADVADAVRKELGSDTAWKVREMILAKIKKDEAND